MCLPVLNGHSHVMATINTQPDATPNSPRYVAGQIRGDDEPDKPINPKSAAMVEMQLAEQASPGYRPSFLMGSVHAEDLNWWTFARDIRVMRRHSAILKPLNYILGALSNVEWTIEASGPEEADFAAKQLQWFWTNAFHRVFTEAAIYGWSAAECVYKLQDGLMVQDEIKVFSSWDCMPLLSRDGKPVGIQVNSGSGFESCGGLSKFWAFRDDIPNKGLWFSHNPLHGGRFGESILRPAWIYWRMLKGRDGAHETAAIAMYRYGTGIIKVWFPPAANKVADEYAPPNAVSGRVSNRDVAGIIGESIKSGSVVKLPSLFDDNGNKLWDVAVETPNTNLDTILSYVRYLEEACSDALGVYPELLRASESGSGYRGREVPLQGFLQAQQPTVNHYTKEWQKQVCDLLVKWNFGADAWVRITPKSLLKSYWKNAQDASQPMEQAPMQAQPMQQASPMAGGGMEGQPMMMGTEEDQLIDVIPSMTLSELVALEQSLLEAGASDE